MRRLALLALICSPAFGALAFVQAQNGGAQASSTTRTTTAMATTTGNTLVVGTRTNAACTTTTTVADTAGNTFYQVTAQEVSGNVCTRAFMAFNIVGHATDVVTMTMGSSLGFSYINVLEFSGTDRIAPRDMSISAGSSGTSCTTGAFSTFRADEVIVFIMQVSALAQTWTAGSGYTLASGAQDADHVIHAQYKIVSTNQTDVTASVTVAGGAIAMAGVSLRIPQSPGGPSNNSLIQ